MVLGGAHTLPTHVHIGPGQLGLGFVGQFFHELKFDTVFLARSADDGFKPVLKKRQAYYVRELPGQGLTEIPFRDLIFFSPEDKGQEQALQAIADPNTSVLTVAVGEAQLSSVSAMVARALKLRKERKEPAKQLYVIACENGDRCSDKLRLAVYRDLGISDPDELGASFVNCMVDRVCGEITHVDDQVVVPVESYREWVLEDPGAEELQNLLNHPNIAMVNSVEFALYDTRKRWLVNGLQLFLAFLGMDEYENIDFSISEVASDPLLRNVVADICAELACAFALEDGGRVFGSAAIEDYVSSSLARLSSAKDPCARILHHILIDDERLDAVARRVGQDVARGAELKKVIARHLYETGFIFFEKAKARMYEPILRLTQAREQPVSTVGLAAIEIKRPHALMRLMLQLVPLLCDQGEILRSAYVPPR